MRTSKMSAICTQRSFCIVILTTNHVAISILNYRDFQQIPLNPRLGRPYKEKITQKPPRAKAFEKTEIVDCLNCGQCMVVCCHNLSTILIKEAFEKNNLERLKQPKSDLCDGHGHCSFVCPARIDLKSSVLRAKGSIRQNKAKKSVFL